MMMQHNGDLIVANMHVYMFKITALFSLGSSKNLMEIEKINMVYLVFRR